MQSSGEGSTTPSPNRSGMDHGYGGPISSSTPPAIRTSSAPNASSASVPDVSRATNRHQPAASSAVCGRVTKQTLKRRVGMAQRGSGFGQAELSFLLDLLEEKLPLCNAEWQSVLVEHDKRFAQQGRNVDSLRHKFATLHRKKIPTGDPLMPEDVRRAKIIRYKMTERTDIGLGDDSNVDDIISGPSAPTDLLPTDVLPSDPAPIDVSPIDGFESDDESRHVLLPKTDSAPSVVQSQENGTSLIDAEGSSRGVLDIRRNPSPRSLVHRRATGRERREGRKDEPDDLMSLLKAQIVQDGLRREEEHLRREQECRDRSLERELERKDKEEQRREERERR